MHPELRLIEDFLTDRGVLALPALPRMLFVVRGAITIGQRVLGQGEALLRRRSRHGTRRRHRRDAVALGAVRSAPAGR